MARADRKLFKLLNDEVNRDLLELLLGREGPRSQAQLTAALDLNASGVSRRMGDLEDEGIVLRDGKRGPYKVVFGAETRELFEAASSLVKLLANAHQASADAHNSKFRREGMAGGHLHDLAEEEA